MSGLLIMTRRPMRFWYCSCERKRELPVLTQIEPAGLAARPSSSHANTTCCPAEASPVLNRFFLGFSGRRRRPTSSQRYVTRPMPKLGMTSHEAVVAITTFQLGNVRWKWALVEAIGNRRPGTEVVPVEVVPRNNRSGSRHSLVFFQEVAPTHRSASSTKPRVTATGHRF